MKNAFYFQLKKYIKSSPLALWMAEMIVRILNIKFLVKKSFLKKQKNSKMTEQEAVAVLEKNYPYSVPKIEFVNRQKDSTIDCSIIVPIYNHENILDQTLSAIINQKCNYKYEVILVDDGSNVATKKILHRYEQLENCQVIYQQNQGIGSARNTGLNHAVGKYIMFVDCDDMVKENIVQILLESALENDSDITMGGHCLIKESNGKVISTKEYIYPEKLIKNDSDENDIMSLPGLPWGKVYKRELFEDVRFIPGYWYEDTIIQFIVYRKCKKFTYVPEILYDYKWHGGNFSNVQGSKANIRSVQRYWMLLLLIKMSKEIGLPEDATFYITLLRHLGSYYYNNIKDFEEELREAMFVAGAELLRRYKPQKKYKMSYMLRQIEKGLLDKQYDLWELACRYQ